MIYPYLPPLSLHDALPIWLALDLSAELMTFPRHLSQHVGGFVITRGRLDEVVPIENAAMADRTVIQWDKDDLDTLRMIKFDALALGKIGRASCRARACKCGEIQVVAVS